VTPPRRNGSFTRVRVFGVAVILGLLVFVTVIDVLDGLFFGDSYHVDASFYTLLAGLTVTFLGGEAIGILAGRADARRDQDER
jgi:uncharacterized membrane protein